jgi:hypothetical protein
LVDAFCHRCGQEATELRVPLRQLMSEALGDLLAFDSRILRTLRPLILRPGFLTAEWSAGRRVAYVPPLRLYVFVAALLFLLMAVTDVALVEVNEGDEGTGGQVALGVGEARAARTSTPGLFDTFGERLAAAWERDPDGLQDGFVDRLGRLALLMAPLSALLLALLYRSRSRYLVEHVVFALHVHAFAFLLLSVLLLLPREGWFFELAARLAGLAVVVYLVLALRRVHGGRWWTTLARSAAFGLLYLLGLLLPLLMASFLWTVYTS